MTSSAPLATAARHIASYVCAVPARLDDRVAAAAPRVVARTDRRRAEQVHRVRLRAEPVEVVAAVGDDVVRVDAVEPCGCRGPGERRLRVDGDVRYRVQQRMLVAPSRHGEKSNGSVDVERPDPVATGEVRDVVRDRRRPFGPRTARCARRRRRRACAAAATIAGMPQVLGRAPAPTTTRRSRRSLPRGSRSSARRSRACRTTNRGRSRG